MTCLFKMKASLILSSDGLQATPRPHRCRRPQIRHVILLLILLVMFTFVILILLTLGVLSLPSGAADDNDSPIANDLSSIVRHNAERSLCDDRRKEERLEVISWEPRASVIHNFLTQRECDYLIDLAKPQMKKSTVFDRESGKNQDSRFRTSSGTFLSRGHDRVVRNIERKIADLTFIPVDHGEGLQIIHYEVGQKYEPHFDYFADENHTRNKGQPMATVLMYLTDVEEGGETVFPNAKGNVSSVSWWNELSKCGKRGLAVKPKMGDALLFWSMNPDIILDPSSLHGGCPVIKGSKWSSTKWIHVDEYKG